MVQNAVVISKAVYSESNEECQDYLTKGMCNHNLKIASRSQNGTSKFILAEEMGPPDGKNRLYIGFRQTNIRHHVTCEHAFYS